MFAVYRSQTIKYLKSASTWIVTAVGVLIVFLISALMPNMAINPDKENSWLEYVGISNMLLPVIVSSLVTFITIFSGLKAATMYKDEVENGNFLVLLSKPISRTKIILMKFASLITMLLLHVFIISISYVISIYSTDLGHNFVDKLEAINSKTLKDTVWTDFALMFGILLLLSTLFSAITLLITTKMSMSSSIAATIGIGVLMPITSVFGTFTQNDEYSELNTNYIKTARSILKSTAKKDKTFAMGELNKALDSYVKIEPSINDLNNLGFKTNNTDYFNYTKFFDFDYQTKVLSNKNPLAPKSGSKLGQITESLLAVPYYLKPLSSNEDNFNINKNEFIKNHSKNEYITKKNEEFAKKVVFTLEQLEDVRDSGLRTYSKIFTSISSLISANPTMSNISLSFYKKELLLLGAYIKEFLSSAQNLTTYGVLFNPLLDKFSLAENDAKLVFNLKDFEPVMNVYLTYLNNLKSSNKELKMNDYLIAVDKKEVINFTAITRLILNKLIESNSEKDKYLNLLEIYDSFESPLSDIVFNDLKLQKIIAENRISVSLNKSIPKIGKYKLTDKDRTTLLTVMAFYESDDHDVVKVKKVLYMDKRINSIIYVLTVVILLSLSIYLITRQDFQ